MRAVDAMHFDKYGNLMIEPSIQDRVDDPAHSSLASSSSPSLARVKAPQTMSCASVSTTCYGSVSPQSMAVISAALEALTSDIDLGQVSSFCTNITLGLVGRRSFYSFDTSSLPMPCLFWPIC